MQALQQINQSISAIAIAFNITDKHMLIANQFKLPRGTSLLTFVVKSA